MKKIILTLALSMISVPLSYAAQDESIGIVKNAPFRREVVRELRNIWTNKESVESYHQKANAYLLNNETLENFVRTTNELAVNQPNQYFSTNADAAKRYFIQGVEERGTIRDYFADAYKNAESLQSFIGHFVHVENWDDLKAQHAEKPNHQLLLAILDHWKTSFERVESYRKNMQDFNDELKSGKHYDAVEGRFKSLNFQTRLFLEKVTSKPEMTIIKEYVQDFLMRTALLYRSNCFFNEIQDFWQAVIKDIDEQNPQ